VLAALHVRLARKLSRNVFRVFEGREGKKTKKCIKKGILKI
jgi:hypothetical protein